MIKSSSINGRKKRIQQLTEDIIAEALKLAQGNQSAAAIALGVDRACICQRIKRSDYLRGVLDECLEVRLDKAEKILSEMIEEKELGAVCFFLKTIGKRRGYIEDKSPHLTTIEVQKYKEIGNALGWKRPDEQQATDIQSEAD